jgi:hypothetical protein
MEEDPAVEEANEYNLAGNCALKDKEYDKAVRFYNYVRYIYFSFYPIGY